MAGILMDQCMTVASATGAFTPDELDVLREVLTEWSAHPDGDYRLLTEERNGAAAAFLIYGPTPMTEFAYDLYWIAVDPEHQKTGLGGTLERRMCALLLKGAKRAVLRVETAGRDEYAGQRFFYMACGYMECGRIPNFYSEGDDLVFYCKEIGEGTEQRT